jgi:Protein of unknown function (DUF1194)/PEP-CTERM motif
MKILNFLKVAVLAVPLALGAGTAKSADYGLALLIDESGSMSAAEYALQVNAYNSVLSNAFFSTYLQAGDTLTVRAFYFGAVVHSIAQGVIIDDATAAAYGTAIAGHPFANGNATVMGDAINAGSAWLSGLGPLTRSIIDISTDGFGNAGVNQVTAANAARAAGHRVNMVTIGPFDQTLVNNTVGIGSGHPLTGFALAAANFADFERVLALKLRREVVPIPGTLLLLGLGLLGLGARRRLAA